MLRFRRRDLVASAVGFGTFLASGGLKAQTNGIVNIYSARHYDIDQKLYQGFTALTGVRVNVVEGDASQLIERLKAEGRNSPADVLITVDAGRLVQAEDAGVLQPVQDTVLEAAVPAFLRGPAGHWFGVSTRARILVYATDRVRPRDLSTYEDLASSKWKGRILVRSSTHVYNQSLVGGMIAALGVEATEAWARGIAANLARPPQGGDIDQIKAVAAGEGDVAIVNSYYIARILASETAEDKAVAKRVAVFLPNQTGEGAGGRGVHINISGAGVAAAAPNRENALRFLRYLVSVPGQRLFAEGNYEFPVIHGVPVPPVLAAWGEFRIDPMPAYVFGRNNQEALRLMDRAGWR